MVWSAEATEKQMKELDSDSSVMELEAKGNKTSNDKKIPLDNEEKELWMTSLNAGTVEPDMELGSVLLMVKHLTIVKDEIPKRPPKKATNWA